MMAGESIHLLNFFLLDIYSGENYHDISTSNDVVDVIDIDKQDDTENHDFNFTDSDTDQVSIMYVVHAELFDISLTILYNSLCL